MPVGKFYEGYGEDEGSLFSESLAEKNVRAFLRTAEGVELAMAFPRIRKAAARRKLLDLVRMLAKEDSGG